MSSDPAASSRPCRVAAVILAAGCSRRMGPDNKLLLEVDGTPLVRAGVQAAAGSGAAATLVVLGHQSGEVAAALQGLEYEPVINPDYKRGMASSLRAGATAARGFDGLAVLLADMPAVASSLLNTLLEVFASHRAEKIVLATHRGRRGHPVIWPAACFDDLAALEGDIGGKDLLEKYEDRVIEIDVRTDAVLLDIDTPGELAAARGKLAASA